MKIGISFLFLSGYTFLQGYDAKGWFRVASFLLTWIVIGGALFIFYQETGSGK